jgi:hypothetical protein
MTTRIVSNSVELELHANQGHDVENSRTCNSDNPQKRSKLLCDFTTMPIPQAAIITGERKSAKDLTNYRIELVIGNLVEDDLPPDLGSAMHRVTFC